VPHQKVTSQWIVQRCLFVISVMPAVLDKRCNSGLSCSSPQTDIAPKCSMFCAFNTLFHIINTWCVSILLKDADISCTSNSVQICTAGSQPLLRALRLAQNNDNMFQQADCIHSLVFILWPKPYSICNPLLSYSKHCLCCSQSPKKACPKCP
jgi:hypothetical protein